MFFVFILFKIKVVDLGFISIGSNIIVFDSLGGIIFKVVIVFIDIVSLKEFSDLFFVVNSLEAVSFIE